MKLQKLFNFISCNVNEIEILLEFYSENSGFKTRDNSYSNATNPFFSRLPRTHVWVEEMNKCNKNNLN